MYMPSVTSSGFTFTNIRIASPEASASDTVHR
jgi:hypothetical protein